MEWLTFSRKQNRCKNLNLNHNLDWRMTRCHSESKHVDISAFVMRVACVRQGLTAIVGHKALVSNKRQQQRYKLKPTSKDDFTDSRTRNSRSLSIGLKLLLVWRYFAQVMGYSNTRVNVACIILQDCNWFINNICDVSRWKFDTQELNMPSPL